MNQFPWGLRMTKYEEQLGADLIEHGLAGHNIAKYSIEKKLNVKWVFERINFNTNLVPQNVFFGLFFWLFLP